MDQIEERWTAEASAQLLGRKIVKVRYMSEREAASMGWGSRPVVLQLDDGNLIYPSMDDEGNDAGAFFTNNERQSVLPTI
jgi:hypothetical protein